MPIIPRAAPFVPSGRFSGGGTATGQLPGGQQIARLGRSLEQVGSVTTSISSMVEEEREDSYLKQGDARMSEAVRNATSRFRELQGLRATEGRQVAEEALRSEVDKIAGAMPSGDAKREFSRLSAIRMANAGLAWDAHERQQVRVANIGATEARAKAAIDDARGAWGQSAEEFAVSAGVVEREARKLAELRQEDGDVAMATVQSYRDAVYGGTVQDLMQAESYDEAARFLDAFGSKMSNGVKGPLRNRVQGLSRKQRLEATAQKQFRELQGRGTLLDQLEKARQRQESGEISVDSLRRVESLLRQEAATVFTQESRAANEALETAQNAARLGEMTPELEQQLEDTGQLDAFRVWSEAGGQFMTTREGFDAMTSVTDGQLLRYPSPDVVKARFRGILNDRDLATMLARYGKVKHAASLPAEDAWKLDRDMLLRRSFRALPRFEGDPEAHKNNPALFEEWEYQVTARVNRNVQGRTAVASDVQQAIDELTKETYGEDGRTLALATPEELEGGRFQTGFVDPTDPDDDGTIAIREVDDDQRRRAMEALQAEGYGEDDITPSMIYTHVKMQVAAERSRDREERDRSRHYWMSQAILDFRSFEITSDKVREQAFDIVWNDNQRTLERYGITRDEFEAAAQSPRPGRGGYLAPQFRGGF